MARRTSWGHHWAMEMGSIDGQLVKAAEEASTVVLDHVPPLIVYRCLSAPSGVQALAASARVSIATQAPGRAEILAMPRRTFGVRPIEILSPTSLTVLTAAVRALDPALAPPSRAKGAWRAHRQFGLTGDHTHVVEMDFASCYELIAHADLRAELILRSFDIATVEALTALLAGLGHRGRGLPQMLEPSDRLADTYLSVLDRRLARAGYSANRFADDVRVLASSWKEANDIIDEAADAGRSLGLVLSGTKTGVWLPNNLDAHELEDIETLSEFVDVPREVLAAWIAGDSGQYGADGKDEDLPDLEALISGYRGLLRAWHSAFKAKGSEASLTRIQLGRHVVRALDIVINFSEDIDEGLLGDLLFDDPTRFEHIARNIMSLDLAGGESEAMQTFAKLVATQRQSAWAKLWGLHVVEAFGCGTRAIPAPVGDWVREQVMDAHEVVRAQALWVLACRGELTSDHLKQAYPHATEVSAPGIAAAAARQQKISRRADRVKALPENLAKAIREDGRLNEEAFRWGS